MPGFNEKQLVENRNTKVTEMETIVNTAKTENRPVSDEEKKKFNDLKKEVENIDATLSMAEEVENMNLKKVPETTPAAGAVTDEAERKQIEAKERKQFANYLRGVRNEDTNITVDDGKVMIPTTIWDRIISKVEEICPIYQWADKFNIKGTFVIPKDDGGNLEVAYADEFEELTAGNVKITSIELKGFLAGALAKISRSLINNTNFDIVGYVEAKMAEKIAKFIEKELLHGTEDKIEGLSGITSAMTVTAEATTAVTADELMDLQDKVVDNYQSNSYWIMSRATRNKIRQLKDKDGNYLLNRDFAAKWGYTLLGRDVYVSAQMDDMAAGKDVVFYGDFSGLAVKISEAANMQLLYEKYATQHAIGLVAWLEMDAKVADTQKIAKLTMAAS